MGKISALRVGDVNSAAKVFKAGLYREVPRGDEPLSRIKSNLKRFPCFIYKENDRIEELVLFRASEKSIHLLFICSNRMRKG